MRWFRRHPAEPPRPAPASEPKPAVVDIEPTAEATATIAPAAHSPASAGVAPDPVIAAAEVQPMRHWHRAGDGMRLPAARHVATRAAAPRMSSGGWHRA